MTANGYGFLSEVVSLSKLDGSMLTYKKPLNYIFFLRDFLKI